MRIVFRSQGVEIDAQLRREIERRLEFALDRHRDRLSAVGVFVADANGPRGGVDKLCQVSATLKGRPPLTALDQSDDLVAGCGRAGKRLALRIREQLRPRRTAGSRLRRAGE